MSHFTKKARNRLARLSRNAYREIRNESKRREESSTRVQVFDECCFIVETIKVRGGMSGMSGMRARETHAWRTSLDFQATDVTSERIADLRIRGRFERSIFHFVRQNMQLFYGLSRAFRLERVLAGVCSHEAFSPLSLLPLARALVPFHSHSLGIACD